MAYDKEIFEGKTLSELFKEIHTNSSKKDLQINQLISQLVEMIESPGEATLIVPLIKDYLEAGIKNNEHLIKLAGIVQRIENSRGDGDVNFDLDELQNWAEEIESSLDQPDTDVLEKPEDKPLDED